MCSSEVSWRGIGTRARSNATIYINHTDEDLIDFARAVEQAVEAGYKEAMSEDVEADLESSLVS